MAYDKVVDSSALDADLTVVANAIKSKSGTTEKLSFPDGFVSALQGIQAGGGGDSSGVIIGSFTPAENTLSVTIDIGSYPEHFLLYTNGDVLGNNLKIGNGLIIDRTLPYVFFVSSNTSGSAYNTAGQTTTYNDSQYFVVNNTRITFADNKITINTSLAAGSSFCYFLAGVTYRWYAW